MIELKIDLEGRVKDNNGKEVNVIPIGIPTRVYAPEQGEKRIPTPRREFMRLLVEQAPKRADAYALSDAREHEDLWPSFDLKYGTIRLYAFAQFYHIINTGKQR